MFVDEIDRWPHRLLPALPVLLFWIYEHWILNLVLLNFGDYAFEFSLILELRRVNAYHLETAIRELLAVGTPPALVVGEVTLAVDAAKCPKVDDRDASCGKCDWFFCI